MGFILLYLSYTLLFYRSAILIERSCEFADYDAKQISLRFFDLRYILKDHQV